MNRDESKLIVGSNLDEINYEIPAHIPYSIPYDPENYQLGDKDCKCRNDSATHIDRHFETWIYTNDSTKADLVRHNRNEEFKKFYQRNHFEQKQDFITAGPIRHLQYISLGLTVEPESQLNLGVKVVNVERSKCKLAIKTQYGRFPSWTRTTYEDIEFVNDTGNYRHTGWIMCKQVNYLLQELNYFPNIFDARKVGDYY